MKTDELIRGLRVLAGVYGVAEKKLLKEAADRLEELDERVAIMTEGQADAPRHILVDDYDEHRFSGLLSED